MLERRHGKQGLFYGEVALLQRARWWSPETHAEALALVYLT